MMLPATQIIKRPLVTEKSTWESNDRNRYAFEVDPRATKIEIRKAVEEIYKVRVQGVATQVRKGVAWRSVHGISKSATWKRATVLVHPEDKIELF